MSFNKKKKQFSLSPGQYPVHMTFKLNLDSCTQIKAFHTQKNSSFLQPIKHFTANIDTDVALSYAWVSCGTAYWLEFRECLCARQKIRTIDCRNFSYHYFLIIAAKVRYWFRAPLFILLFHSLVSVCSYVRPLP